MTPQELNELLEQADRSKAWLARKLGVAERTVQRWADPGTPWPVPATRDAQIRTILAPSIGACPVCGNGRADRSVDLQPILDDINRKLWALGDRSGGIRARR